MPTVDADATAQAGAEFLVEVVVPPIVLRVVVTVIERGIGILHVSLGTEAHGVFAKAEVEIGIALDTEGT